LVALVAILLTHYTVLNVEQRDGLKLQEMLPSTEPNDIEIDETSEAIVQGWEARPELQLTGASEGRAYYRR
jgi:antirestriction protein ArdC